MEAAYLGQGFVIDCRIGGTIKVPNAMLEHKQKPGIATAPRNHPVWAAAGTSTDASTEPSVDVEPSAFEPALARVRPVEPIVGLTRPRAREPGRWLLAVTPPLEPAQTLRAIASFLQTRVTGQSVLEEARLTPTGKSSEISVLQQHMGRGYMRARIQQNATCHWRAGENLGHCSALVTTS